jgi:hypothetical protein
MNEISHQNYVSPIISIRHNCFGITFIQKIRLLLIIIQKFIHVTHSFKYFIHFVTFIHAHVVFTWCNCFSISFIHTFQLVKSFIQKNCLLKIIIQKVHCCSTFIHVHVEKIFFMSFQCGIKILQIYSFLLTCSCS